MVGKTMTGLSRKHWLEVGFEDVGIKVSVR